MEAQDNPFTSVLMVGAADPEALAGDADPGAGSYRLVMGTDDKLYILDETGNATEVGAAAGAVATDAIWDAAGDLAVGSGANTAARLAIGATNGMVLMRVGGAVAWALPPGHQFDYAQYTSAVSVTATSEATANTVVTAGAVTYDGSTQIMVEFFCPYLTIPSLADVIFCLYDGSTALGGMSLHSQETVSGGTARPGSYHLVRKLTPTAAAHTYSIRCYTSTGTASVGAGAGGTGAHPPGFIRQTKVV